MPEPTNFLAQRAVLAYINHDIGPTVGAVPKQTSLNRNLRSKDGMSLIEVLVVIVIIGLLVAIAIPAFLGNQRARAQDAEAKSYLGTSGHLSAALWRIDQRYPALGNKITKNTLMWQLAGNEPELTYGNTIANDSHFVQVNLIDKHRVTYAARSDSGTIFCLEVIEIDIDGYKAGDYWSSGPETAWDPCGKEASGGAGPIPQGANVSGKVLTGIPDPPVIFNKDLDTRPFRGAGVLANGTVYVGTNSDLSGGVQTNGYVQLQKGATICGDVQVGPGQTVYNNGGTLTCDSKTFNGSTLFPAPNAAPVENDNGNMWKIDKYTGSKDPYDPVNRTLTIASNKKVTLYGDTYVFCSLDLRSNSELIFANTGDVTIYIDSPENCPTHPQTQLLMNSNTDLEAPEITVLAGSAPRSVALVFLGSAFQETTLRLDSNSHLDPDCTGTFIIYAPRTHLDMASNSEFCGAVAAKTVTMAANSTLNATGYFADWQIPTGLPDND